MLEPLAPRWSQQEIDMANELLMGAATYSDIADAINRRFKSGRTVGSLSKAIWRGILKRPKRARKAAQGRNADGQHIFFFLERKAPPEDEFAHLYQEDALADIGKELIDLKDDECRYPVARWPQEFPKQRFCGAATITAINRFGKEVPTSYCRQHYQICHQTQMLCEAAE